MMYIKIFEEFIFDSLPDPVILYRAVAVEDGKDIDLVEPGHFWSFDQDAAYSFGEKSNCTHMLRAKVKKKDIDQESTIKANDMYKGEKEITIDDQDKLFDVEVIGTL